MAGENLFQVDDQAGCRQGVSRNRRRIGAVSSVICLSKPCLNAIGTSRVSVIKKRSVTAGMMELMLFLGCYRHPETKWKPQSAWLLQQGRLSFAANANGSPL
jgi:hypothetical protein